MVDTWTVNTSDDSTTKSGGRWRKSRKRLSLVGRVLGRETIARQYFVQEYVYTWNQAKAKRLVDKEGTFTLCIRDFRRLLFP